MSLPSSGVHPRLPRSIGRFEVRALLGSGAFGVVYRCFDPQLQREVALKVPHPAILADPRLRERFLREARTAAGLRHPHIVPVFDAGEIDGQPYLAAAFIAGRTLTDLVREKRLDLPTAVRIVRDLAAALTHAHSQGVIHRDVKPDNILVDLDKTAYLMDFGLAFRQEAADKLTHDGDVLGTPAYMAPEQARGRTTEPLPAGDQYSLGVILYELLTGRTPFSGNAATLLAQVLTEPPPRPHALNSRIPLDVETICLKCLAKQPQDRYADCRDLADDLRRWSDGEPIQARRLSLGERLVRWCQREPWIAGGVLSAGLALVLAAVVPLTLAARLATMIGEEDRARADASAQAVQAKEQAEEAERQGTRAEEAARLARAASAAAEKATAEAQRQTEELDKATVKARQAKALADESKAKVDRYSYVAHINLLAQNVADGERTNAADILDRARNAAGGEEQRCGFEWWYVRTRLSSAVVKGTLPELPSEVPAVEGETYRTFRFQPILGRLDLILLGGKLPAGPHQRRVIRNLAPAGDEAMARQRLADHGRHAVQVTGATTAVWHLPSGSILPLAGFTHSVGPVAFLPRPSPGSLLATTHGSEEVRLWAENESPLKGTILPMKDVKALTFSPDGKLLVTASGTDEVRWWDVADRRDTGRRTTPAGKRIQGLHFAPDGKTLAISSTRGIELFAADSGNAIGGVLPPGILRFSRDGKYLAIAGPDRPAWFRRYQVGVENPVRLPLPDSVSAVRDFDLTPNGEFVAIATEKPGAVSVVNIRTGQPRVLLTGFGDRAPLPAFSEDGGKLVISDDNAVVSIHKADTWEKPTVMEDLPKAVPALAVVGKTPQVAIPDDKGVALWDLATGDPGTNLPEPRSPVVMVAGVADRLVTALQDGTVKVRTGASFAAERSLDGPGGEVSALTVSADGTRAAAGRADGSLQRWDTTTGKQTFNLPGKSEADAVTALAFGPDGKQLFVGDKKGVVRRLDADNGKELARFTASAGGVSGLALSPDGKRLVSVGADKVVRLWNLDDGKEAAALKGHSAAIRAVAFAPDGRTIASGGDDNVIRLWEPVTAQGLAVLKGHTGAVTALVFTPDGKTLLSSGADRTLRWWTGR
jgi:WD40 repeat protein